MSDYIVEMRHITKRFPGIVANDDVTIQIKKGEIYALLGENGAGKSTLMSMLFGMYEPDEGEIYVRGEKVAITSPNHAASLNIGMVHQHFKLVHNYTVTENIVMGMEPIKKVLGFIPTVDMKKANQEVEELSRRYGLDINPTDVIEDINVSTRQRVEILKMLYREAEILIFDEPTAVLTPQEIEFLLEIIRQLRENGKTIILITHKLEEIKQVADRCAILCKGKLIDVLDVSQTDTKTMANLMVGREVQFTTEKKDPVFRKEVLKVEHLTVKNKDHFPVVKDVSFSIRGGEVFAIAGVSGNGQVEIADAVVGLAHAAEGHIYLNGEEITHKSIRERALSGISYIPEDRQERGLEMDFSLAENLGLKSYFEEPFSKKGIMNKEAFDTYGEKLIGEYDIRSGQGIRTIVRSMSGGNQQKAIVARWISTKPKVLILDEPTKGIDVGAKSEFYNMICSFAKQGLGVILISSELPEVIGLSDRIIVMKGRQISGEVMREEASETQLLSLAMIGKVEEK